MAISAQSSVLSSAANKIVSANINSTSSFVAARKEYKKFGDFIYIKTLELERSEIPNANSIKKLSRINVTSTFGSAGGLLSSFLSGALDVGGLIRGFFPGRDRKVGQAPATTTAKSKPKLKGSRLRLSGGRALPIVGTLFAGLDFATGLAEGESIGKSAAGTAGSLAGSLLGGAIGQALIPVPGVGFVIGSAVGGFLGGWTADRAYNTGTSILSGPKERQEQKLEEGKKKEEPKVKEDRGLIMRQNSLISNFDGAVEKFSELVDDFISGKVSIFSDEMPMDEEPSSNQNRGDALEGEVEDNLMVEGGILPSKTYITSSYGERRKGYYHQGVDYASGKGAGVSPVSVIKPGVVTLAREEGDYGNVVFIKHPDGIESIYGHLHKINVREGQKIEPGTVIGYEGSTGKSSGPHVHFELRRNNAKLPIEDNKGDEYFRFGGNVKVTPKPNTQPSAQSSAASELFNLEIHSPHKRETQRSGLIRSVIDPESGMTRSLMGQFGSYKMGFRDLGAPKRGLNILESDMLKGVEYNAQRIIAAIKSNPNIQVNIFAGHNDLKKGEGETGAEGEMEYNRMVAERVEQLAREQGLKNVTYIRSQYARLGTDPTSNWSRANRLREEHIQRKLNSRVSANPTNPITRDIAYTPSYNRPSFVALNNQIIAMNSPTPTPRVPSTQYTSSSLSISGRIENKDDIRSYISQIQEVRNSIA